MNIIYRPPLKHIALVRIALGILRTFDQQAIDTNFLTANGDVSGKYCSEVIYKIETFLHGRGIPSCIKKEIFGIIRSLALEVERWVYSHNEILHDSNIKFSDICWYSYGVVDRFETAQTLVRKESIEIQPRFALSCKYYFKDHARTLWNSSSIFDKMILADNYSSVRSMWFWIDESQTDYVTDAILLHHNYVTEIVDFNENYLGLRCYFTRLGPEARYRCLSYGVTEAKIHHFDLYLCFAELTIDEVKDLFRHLSASNRFRVMELFLYWPLQFIFVEVLDQLWSLTSHYNLRNIFRFILEERIDKYWRDVDYVQLVQNIWARCPVSHKNILKKDKIYEKVELLFTKKSVL